MPIPTAELLQTKLQRPGVTCDLIPRPRLIERLNQGLTGRLTLVCAPAGFGKSTLVSSWIEGMAGGAGGGRIGVTPPLPCAWLSLDENDSNLALFLRYFIAALRSIVPEACPKAAGMLLAPQPPPLDTLFATLSNEVARLPDRFVLVLDDYYTIRGEAVHDFLNALVCHWPPPMHLVLNSRLDPPLPLASLRAKGLLTEIRSSDLRFTREEAAAYMDRMLPTRLSESAMTLLEQRTEGWIAGLHLASLSLRAGEDVEAILASLSGAETDIADYLIEEVVSRQPPEIQKFLLRTSILDRFCASLCEAVAGSDHPDCDVHACMEWVERGNLFLIPLDNRAEWYRYHHLFQGLLQQRLLAEVSHDHVTEMHCRAAEWFAQRGLVDEALRHALAANDLDLAARFMEQGLRDVLNREDRLTLERWLRLLPEETVQRRPGTLLLKAWALQFSWQLGAIAKLLQQVELLLNQDQGAAVSLDDSQELSLLRGQVALLRGQQAYYLNRPAETLDGCQEGLALLPPSWTYARGGAMLFWAMGMRASGRGDAAQRALFDEYESLGEKADAYALRLLFAACHNFVESGQLEQMRQTAQLMLEQATRSRLVVLQGWALYWLGLAGYYRNDLDTARQHLRELVDRRYAIHAMAARNGMIALVLLHQAEGDTSAAWQTMELLSRYDLARLGYEADDARSLRARLHLVRGDPESAFRWADGYTAPVPDAPLTWLQDPHMIKARVLLARGGEADVQSALDIMDALCEIAERTHNTRGQIEFLAVRALALDAEGRAGDAMAELGQAVELSRPGGFIRTFVDLGQPMAGMLGRLVAQGFAAETIRHILAAFPDQRETLERSDLQSAIGNRRSAIIEPLTMREHEVLLLLRERLSNKEIAGTLYLSTATVKRHLVNIYGKLGVNKRREAVLKAETLGILPRR